jgi:hypothetical protein
LEEKKEIKKIARTKGKKKGGVEKIQVTAILPTSDQVVQ